MAQQKPVKKPKVEKGCEVCRHKSGDFEIDEINPNIIRCYCRARHFKVDVEAMNNECDFYDINPMMVKPRDDNRFGL